MTFDRIIIGSLVTMGAVLMLFFAALLVIGPDFSDIRNQCETKQYTNIRVCDRSK